MKVSLKTKFVGLVTAAAILPVVVSCWLILQRAAPLQTRVNEELQQIANNEAGQIVQLVYQMCQMNDRQNQRRLEALLASAHAELDRVGQISFSETPVLWKGRNQNTQQTADIPLPGVNLGDVEITPNADFKVESPVVDAVTKFSGGYCTIFQRINEQGEMLRVATTVPTADGKRAIGTFIPSTTPEGLPNPVLAKVIAGQTFVGRAKVLNEWHASAYGPLYDSSDKTKVVGMLYVGFPLLDIHKELRMAVSGISVGKTGEVYVLGGKGDQRGHFLINKAKAKEGEDAWDMRSREGVRFIQSMVTKALALPEGGVAWEHYTAPDASGVNPRRRVDAVAYYAPWDWVLVAGMYEDDYHSVLQRVDSMIKQLLRVSTVGGLGVMLLAIGFALFLGAALARPIGRIIYLTQTIARGDLAAARESLDSMQRDLKLPSSTELAAATPAKLDEPGQLFAAISTMTQGLSSLVTQVQRSSVQLVATATHIAATSREQEGVVTELSGSTTKVAASVKEISATTQVLAQTMQDVQTSAVETEAFADSGRAGLAAMAISMRQLAEATAAISTRLVVIKEKTTNIEAVVTTITKVAHQTNLLSLNASIEAEKAGEYGRGFAVVAREIRRLADQTAVSSLNIERTVEEMRSSVSAGVMEMDKFTSEVTRGVHGVEEIGEQLTQILEHVKQLTPRFQTVNEGMRAQSQGALEISDTMVQLSEAAQRTSESIQQFNAATDQLKSAARDLQQEVSRFKA